MIWTTKTPLPMVIAILGAVLMIAGCSPSPEYFSGQLDTAEQMQSALEKELADFDHHAAQGIEHVKKNIQTVTQSRALEVQIEQQSPQHPKAGSESEYEDRLDKLQKELKDQETARASGRETIAKELEQQRKVVAELKQRMGKP